MDPKNDYQPKGSRRRPVLFMSCVLFVTCARDARSGAEGETTPDPDSCGQSSLYILMELLDSPVALKRIRDVTNPGSKGQLSMLQMCQAAERFGVVLQGRRVPLDYLMKIRTPLIQHVSSRYEDQPGHYRVLRPAGKKIGLQVIDPGRPPRILTTEQLVHHDESEMFVLVPVKWQAAVWQMWGRWAALVLAGISLVLVYAWRLRRNSQFFRV